MLPRLRAQFTSLIRRRASFEAATRSLSENQVRFRPAPGAWSIAEVAHHLLHVEREVTRAALKPGIERRGRRRNAREWFGLGAFLAIVHLNRRIRIPKAVAGRVTPSTNPDMDELWSEWSGVHAELEGFLSTATESDLSQMAFKHPIIGPTTVSGTLPFLSQHFNHHMRQVERIRRSPGFPRA